MKKDVIEVLARGILSGVDDRLKNLEVDKTFFNCRIMSANGNKYKVKINNQEKNVVSLSGLSYKIGDMVPVTVPCSDWNHAYIVGQTQQTGSGTNLEEIQNRVYNLEQKIELKIEVLYYNSYLMFPIQGNIRTFYIDTTTNKLYRWNNSDSKYYELGNDFSNIKIINGGNASD